MKLTATRIVMNQLLEITIANMPGKGRTLPMPSPEALTP